MSRFIRSIGDFLKKKTKTKTVKSAEPRAKTVKSVEPRAKTVKSAEPRAKTVKSAESKGRTVKSAESKERTVKSAESKERTVKSAESKGRTGTDVGKENSIDFKPETNEYLLKHYVIDIGDYLTKKLPHYITMKKENNKNMYSLSEETGSIVKELSFDSLNSYLDKINKAISLFIAVCKVPFVCSEKIKNILKSFNDRYKIFLKNNTSYKNNKDLILTFYLLVYQLSQENAKSKEKKYIFLRECNNKILDKINIDHLTSLNID